MKANGEVDYDRAGDHYSTLVALLKAKSKQFAENIVKQVRPHVCTYCTYGTYMYLYVHAYLYIQSMYMYMYVTDKQ